MAYQTGTKQKENKGYRVILLLLVALAALSSAMRDLDRLQEVTREFHELALAWTEGSLVTVSAAEISGEANPYIVELHNSAAPEEFRWSGRLGPGKMIEIKGINGDIEAEAATGSEVEVVANKHSRKSDVNTVTIKVVEHAAGVTICAVYKTEDLSQSTPCEPGGGGEGNNKTTSERISINNNDVAVDFRVKVPAGVDFVGQTINGELSANTLASNVVGRTVNGSIRISTSGYARAKTVNGGISASVGNANWPGSLEFKTVNGEIVLDLPATINTSIEASTFNGEISSDFPLNVLGKFSRKKVTGTIGAGGRDLILKTLNGNIHLRRAG